jgi:NAD(P) transhydrogenase
MADYCTHLIAIGSGPPARRSRTGIVFGHRRAVIRRGQPGGTVTTTGGAPTKTLREALFIFQGS